MVKFLITRPVAVIMTFLAVIMLGIVASGRLPVSLMPDIDIPEITVAVSTTRCECTRTGEHCGECSSEKPSSGSGTR